MNFEHHNGVNLVILFTPMVVKNAILIFFLLGIFQNENKIKSFILFCFIDHFLKYFLHIFHIGQNE